MHHRLFLPQKNKGKFGHTLAFVDVFYKHKTGKLYIVVKCRSSNEAAVLQLIDFIYWSDYIDYQLCFCYGPRSCRGGCLWRCTRAEISQYLVPGTQWWCMHAVCAAVSHLFAHCSRPEHVQVFSCMSSSGRFTCDSTSWSGLVPAGVVGLLWCGSKPFLLPGLDAQRSRLVAQFCIC